MSDRYYELINAAKAVRTEDELARRGIKLRRVGGEMVGPCPLCGGKDRFAINLAKQKWNCRQCKPESIPGDVIGVVQWLDNCAFADAVERLAGEERIATRARHNGTWRADPMDAAARVEFAQKIWSQSAPLAGSLGERYLRQTRCIDLESWPPSLRFHPQLFHGPSGRTFPGIVAAVQHAAGDFRGVWRIFLDPRTADKAPVPSPRMGLGPVAGAAVHLSPAGEEIAIAEGVETGLAVMCIGRMAWAGLSTSLMRRISLPAEVRRVYLLEENDKPDDHGRRASPDAVRVLAQRLLTEGRQVYIVRPPGQFKDFNDWLMSGGRAHVAA
jgi:hypothetical protein